MVRPKRRGGARGLRARRAAGQLLREPLLRRPPGLLRGEDYGRGDAFLGPVRAPGLVLSASSMEEHKRLEENMPGPNTYATGQELLGGHVDDSDSSSVEATVTAFAESDYLFTSMIEAIELSDSFRFRKLKSIADADAMAEEQVAAEQRAEEVD